MIRETSDQIFLYERKLPIMENNTERKIISSKLKFDELRLGMKFYEFDDEDNYHVYIITRINNEYEIFVVDVTEEGKEPELIIVDYDILVNEMTYLSNGHPVTFSFTNYSPTSITMNARFGSDIEDVSMTIITHIKPIDSNEYKNDILNSDSIRKSKSDFVDHSDDLSNFNDILGDITREVYFYPYQKEYEVKEVLKRFLLQTIYGAYETIFPEEVEDWRFSPLGEVYKIMHKRVIDRLDSEDNSITIQFHKMYREIFDILHGNSVFNINLKEDMSKYLNNEEVDLPYETIHQIEKFVTIGDAITAYEMYEYDDSINLDRVQFNHIILYNVYDKKYYLFMYKSQHRDRLKDDKEFQDIISQMRKPKEVIDD